MKSTNLGMALMTGALLLAVGCTPAAPSSPEADLPTGDVPAAVESTSSQGGDVGNVTEDIWVELTTQEIYEGNRDPEAWIAAGGGRERMFARYGVTEEQLQAFGEQMNNDPERVQVLLGKMATRLQELEGVQ